MVARDRARNSLVDTVPGRSMPPPRRGEEWRRCIRAGDTPGILHQLIGEQAGFDSQRFRTCSCAPA
ncbi:hypothetical protein [Sphingomonas liriopis]|nr:hypothetical protein [Sphingomonas liriopis]